MDLSLGADMACTGFGWAAWLFPSITACCVEHDLGGTDAALLECLFGALPSWAWVPAIVAVLAMIRLRPIYNWLQRRGLVR